MSNRLLCIDYETFYSTKEYTFKKMTTEAYVRDPRFAAICMGYVDGEENGWIRAAEIPEFLSRFDWSTTSVFCHNAQFDGLILSHHYCVYPSRFVCTLAMAHALYPDDKASLEALAEKFGLGTKTVPYSRMNGVHPSVMSEELLQECGRGAANDCAVTVQFFKQMLADGFPRRELPIVDMTVQMFTRPQLVGDVGMLQALRQVELDKSAQLLADLHVSAKDVGSNTKFQALLEAQGIEVEMKDGKNKPIPAFAATDPFMQALEEDENPTVRALAEARLTVKSNIRGTRAESLPRRLAGGRCRSI